ncbi:sensor histidine kinase [Clavibacter michiganensis]|uniref:sensor histidine kinase n=1 Tax=Clavibacter michiganensis TaxID=28447 RepID=UPI001F396A97|nr:HAMP domain-containing sensor histidine kinase [Clavibacter michiganensis]
MVAPLSALDEQRLRGSSRAQLPFLASAAIVAALVALSDGPVERDPWYLGGIALVGASSLLCVVLAMSALPTWLLILVPALDLVAVAAVIDAAAPTLPAAALLVIFPLLWLVFAFPTGGVPVAIGGALAVSVLPLVRRGAPDTALGWAGLVGLTLLMTLLVLAGGQAAAMLRRARAELAEATETQTRLLEESREQTATIRDVADAVDVGIVFFDADDRPILRNAAVRTLLDLAGYDHATGMAPSVYGSDRVTRVATDGAVLTEALYADRAHGPVYWVGEPGDQRALVITVRAIGRRPGRRAGSVLAAYDVTDLAQAVQVRDEFLATVSHELRTPLTSIVGYLDLIDELHDPDELGIATEIAVIQRNVAQLSTIIGSLLEGADHAPDVDHAPVDLSAVVRASADAARGRAVERGLVLDVDVAPDVGMEGDATRIAQVVGALLANAVLYTPAGRIHVALERDGDTAVLRVEDTGVGISEEDQQHVLDRFFRARTARDTAIPGLGLGLSIAERTVRAHGGTIEIASRLGEGTRVAVRLPRERTVPRPMPGAGDPLPAPTA